MTVQDHDDDRRDAVRQALCDPDLSEGPLLELLADYCRRHGRQILAARGYSAERLGRAQARALGSLEGRATRARVAVETRQADGSVKWLPRHIDSAVAATLDALSEIWTRTVEGTYADEETTRCRVVRGEEEHLADLPVRAELRLTENESGSTDLEARLSSRNEAFVSSFRDWRVALQIDGTAIEHGCRLRLASGVLGESASGGVEARARIPLRLVHAARGDFTNLEHVEVVLEEPI